MNRTVLLAGSSYSAIPIMGAMKKRGWQVHIAGSIESDPCHAHADGSHSFDYSDREQLLEVVKKNRFEYLCPSCNDDSYTACAWVAEELGLPGYDSFETTRILHDKGAFRRFTESKGFPVPEAHDEEDLRATDPARLTYPMLVKPVDSFSGRGMARVDDPAALALALAGAREKSKCHQAVAERFIEGSLHSHSAFIKDGRILGDFFVDEYCSVYPYQVDCSNYPSLLDETLRRDVRGCIQDLVASLGLHDGLLHTQFMVHDDRFSLIECMRRGPGDLYYRMIELATGIDGMDLYALPFLGSALPPDVRASRSLNIARHTISADHEIVPTSFEIKLDCEALEIVPLKLSGQTLGPAPYDKLAIFFARFSNLSTMLSVTPELADTVAFQSYGA